MPLCMWLEVQLHLAWTGIPNRHINTADCGLKPESVRFVFNVPYGVLDLIVVLFLQTIYTSIANPGIPLLMHAPASWYTL
jgi:hypothetical protein